jgi:hypothetical protein
MEEDAMLYDLKRILNKRKKTCKRRMQRFEREHGE